MSATSSPEAEPAEVDPAGPPVVEQPKPQEAELPDQFEGEIPFPEDVEPLPALHEVKPTGSSQFSSLPDGLIHLILKYLGFDELYILQFVDNKCFEISRQDDLWSNKEFTISKDLSDETVNTMISSLPKVRYIKTVGNHIIHTSLLDVILNSVQNLEKLNCKFTPSLSLIDIETIINTYTNIRSLRIDNNDNLEDKVTLLAQVPSINEVLISKCKYYLWSDVTENIIHQYINVCTLIEQFQLVTKLDICGLYLESDALNDAFIHLLDEKKLEVKSLTAAFRNDNLLLQKLGECTSLTELYLTIHYRNSVNFDYDLTDLQNLTTLGVVLEYNNFPPNFWPQFRTYVNQMLSATIIPNCFPRLVFLKLSIKFLFYDGPGILEKIINCLPLLKVLKLSIHRSSSINNEIKKLENLQHLEEFHLNTFTKLSDESIQWVSFARKLKYIKFKNCINFMSGSKNRKVGRIGQMIGLTHVASCLHHLVFKRCYFCDLPDDIKNELIMACNARKINLKYDSESIHH